MKKVWSLVALIIVLIVVDQVTKLAIVERFYYGETYNVIPGFFNLAYVRNTGAAFGMGQGVPEWVRVSIFLVLPLLFCGWIAYLLSKSLKGPLYLSIAYALIIAGAIGNLIDRFRLGFVVDMFMFFWKKEEHHFHVFNVADSCISIAAGLLIFEHFRSMQLKQKVSQG